MTDRHTVRRALVMAGVGGVAAAGLIGPGAANAYAAEACPDVEVVFARGTAEPVGVGRVGQAFVEDLRSSLSGQSVGVYAVNYPASYDFLQSAPQGADEASAHIQATVASCPDTSIVLGGYSQGAAVVDLITADPNATFGFGRPMPRRSPTTSPRSRSSATRRQDRPYSHLDEPAVRSQDHRSVQRCRPGVLRR